MTVKSCEKLEKSRVALTIETSAEEFEAAVNKAYLKMRGKINVPGFRVGKAPRKIIEKMYGAEVFYEEAVNIILPDAYEAAVKEQGLETVGYPQVELESCTKDGVVFKCTVAVYPEVKLGQYKGLEAPKAEVKVAAADVNARLKEMADRNSRLVSVERAVKKGDTADIDFEGFDNGVAFDGGKGENFDLEIGSGSFVPGFEEQLIGMKAGEEKDIDITFPENYTPELAGKPVVFHVKVNEVKVKEVPAIDDEFAKDVSEFDTLKDLKADIKKKMTAERTEAAQRAFEDVLMAKVAEGVEADIPQEMVELQAERMMEQFKQQLASQGIPFDQYLKMTGTTEADFRQQAEGPASEQVKMDLAVEAIIKAEGLEASDEDVENEMKSMAEKYGMDLDTVKKYLRPEDVKEQVVREKVMKLVADNAVAVAPAEEKAELEAEGEIVEKKPAKKAAAKKAEGEKTEGEKAEKKPAAKKTAKKDAE
jgi:trigger factor